MARYGVFAEDTHHHPQEYRKRPERYPAETPWQTANHRDLNLPRKLTFRGPHKRHGFSEAHARDARETPPLSHLSDNHDTER